jgi:pimeloyl-ACP methyl ester carboxylesterase
MPLRFTRLALILPAIVCASMLTGCASTFDPLQRSLLYFPQPVNPADPGVQRQLPIADQHIFYRLLDHPGTNALIYFGGNGDDAPATLPLLRSAFPERALYVLEYRGYGESSGEPSEAALVSDALTLFDCVHLRSDNIVVMGRSLGSGIAVQVAADRPASGLILVTPYDSIFNLAKGRFSYLPLDWMMRDRYESWKFAPRISVPTVMLLASNDSVVPRDSSDALRRAFDPKILTFAVVADTDHNDILASPNFLLLLNAILSRSDSANTTEGPASPDATLTNLH